MVTKGGIADAVFNEQFKRFKEDSVLQFADTDEELDEAAKQLGMRSLADLRSVVILHVFMRNIEQSAKYN